MGTWPIPRGSPYALRSQAFGTQATCSAQGFFIQLGIAAPFFNGMLSIYYLLTVRYGWKEKKIKKLQKYFFGIPIIFALATAFASLGLSLYNNSIYWCWIAASPLLCDTTIKERDGSDCERGRNAWLFRWVFYFLPLFIIIFIATTSMILIYIAVKKTEQKSKKWRIASRSENEKKLKNSQRVLRQAFVFLLVFYFVYLPPLVAQLVTTVQGTLFFPLSVFQVIFVPAQGLLNYIVYIVRPKYLKYQKENPEICVAKLIRMCCLCCMLKPLNTVATTGTTICTAGTSEKKDDHHSDLNDHPEEETQLKIPNGDEDNDSTQSSTDEH